MTDAEFLYEDGRKAEKVEIDNGKTKVVEVYVEPKLEKKLAQRITEKYCICEREIETIDEKTGEVLSRVVEKVFDGQVQASEVVEKSPMEVFVEEKMKKNKMSTFSMILVGVMVAQLIGLAYLLFVM
jgi:hypothetical protein